jgi:hypothetical protein
VELADLPSPALVVDLAAVDRGVARAAGRFAGPDGTSEAWRVDGRVRSE